MTAQSSADVHSYYRQITDVDIGEVAGDVLAGRITQESQRTLQCDCPNHRSQSHRSLHIMLDKQGWYCFGCGVGGDVLQLVEFVQSGQVTRGQSGRMPESHRQARDYLAGRAGLPPLSGLSPGDAQAAEEAHALILRVHDALTEIAEFYHQRLLANPDVLTWFREKYGIGDEMAARLKIGFAENENPSIIQSLMNGPSGFTRAELAATSAFRPTAQDGLIPFFEGRIVFPYGAAQASRRPDANLASGCQIGSAPAAVRRFAGDANFGQHTANLGDVSQSDLYIGLFHGTSIHHSVRGKAQGECAHFSRELIGKPDGKANRAVLTWH
jgi:DNA primase